MARFQVRPVRTKKDLRAFVDLAWDVYRDDPNWVPPLKSDQARLLTPGRHPFWNLAERELFLAEREGRPVGRIAAIVDHNANKHQSEHMGVWGFFECHPDPEAAMALFRAVEEWLRVRGSAFLRGPLNPSPNYEIGLLVRGHETPPTLMMTYNPAYYAELVSLCGFRKEKDLLAYLFPMEMDLPSWAESLAERLVAKGEFRVRVAERSRLREEIRLLNRVYNECWEDSWGHVPISDAELEDAARTLRFIVDTDLGFFVYRGDEPVAVCLLLPDLNPLLKRLDGRLGLTGLLKRFLYRKEITGLRGLLLGVKEAYRQAGVPFVVLSHLRSVLARKPQYRYVEMGWNLENNPAINLLYEDSGLMPHKRYRIYRKELPCRPA